jgi:bifunctional non-homologous end joining protein LigD
MPIEWSQLKTLKAANLFTMKTAIAHLRKRKTDPWKNYFKVKQKISILKRARE